jgi:hypothetical protein
VAGRGLEAAPDQAVTQVEQQAPRNRDSGFATRRSASEAASRGEWTAQPALLRARGRLSATATTITATTSAPSLRVGRDGAVAVLPNRAGWTRERAMLIEANSEAKGGHQARPFQMFPDSDQREAGPMATAAWVLPGVQPAGALPRDISICNEFL